MYCCTYFGLSNLESTKVFHQIFFSLTRLQNIVQYIFHSELGYHDVIHSLRNWSKERNLVIHTNPALFRTLAKIPWNTCFSRLLAWAEESMHVVRESSLKKLHCHCSMCFKWSLVPSNLFSGFLPGLFIAISTCCRNRALVYVGGVV